MGAEAWTAHEPANQRGLACHEHARQLLASHGQFVRRIVQVNADSILYLNPAGRAMTAWLGVSDDGRKQKITPAAGFPAWPD